ncbi:MAG: hypothetical protein ACPG5P_03055, partial [Saprospiraceae bacterium]
MKDISIYFSPIQGEFNQGEFTVGSYINQHNGIDFPELEPNGIAFFDVPEYRNHTAELKAEKDLFRSQLYSLYQGDNWTKSIYDLGTIQPGENVEDTYFAVAQSVAELLKKNIIPIVIGGSLDLDSGLERKQNEKYSLGFDYGSFNDISVYGGAIQNWGKNDFHQSRLKLLYHQSENNYPYTNNNVAGTPREKLPHAAFRQWGIQQQNIFKIGENNLKTNLWYVNHDREIPPTATQNTSSATQKDELLQGVISWLSEDNSNDFNYDISSRYLYEHIIYDAPGIFTDSRAIKFNLRSEFNYKKEKHHFSFTPEYEYSQAIVDDYDLERPNRNRFILLGNYNTNWGNNSLDISVREEFIDDYFSPFLFHFKYGRKIDFNQFQLKIEPHLSRNFQLPTFNDLFWAESGFSAGNPNLEPEKNWKEELKFKLYYSPFNDNYNNSNYLTISIFNSNSNNWILWSPNDFGRWSPNNVKKVWARGIEVDASHHFIKNNNKYSLKGNYSSTKTTNQEEGSLSDGKQLIYTP